MTKIAIISQPEHGVIVDVEGCANAAEATQHLTSALPVSSQFWEGMEVDLKLGKLGLTPQEVSQILSTVKEAGISPRHILTANNFTKQALAELNFSAIPASYSAPSLIMSNKQASNNAAETSGSASATIALQEPLEFFQLDRQKPGQQGKAKVEAAKETSQEAEKAKVADLAPITNGLGSEFGTTSTTDHAGTGQPGTDQANAGQMENQAANKEAVENNSAASANSVALTNKEEKPPQVLLLKQTLRAGQAVSHRGHLVIIGDVNPGAEVIAEGDITVWGALRGMAHAGVGNNTKAEIRALKLQAIQLRIAHAIARAPDQKKVGLSAHSGPEVARIADGKIRISSGDPE